MGVVVDTSVFIAFERNSQAVELDGLPADEDLFLSAVTVSELLVGVYRADSPARRNRRLAFVEAILADFPVLPIDTEAARVHAQLHAAQLDAGLRSGAHDLLIAATALANGFSVLTRDVDDFQRVPGLTVYPVSPR
ncbi:MAG: type II toxin-antitoxin system VapC family toxin [Wenzhouxiangella sp.]|nr:MAG: type II toxin-antitoxin system VapC family toxin [Wenzhouxiangella sp.]